MDKLKNFILIGGVGVGKTSLFNSLLGIKGEANKTQAMVYHNESTVDTPGEFFDNPRFYSAIICSMMDIDTIVYVHQCNNIERKLPHGLFNIYEPKNIIGVISKVDLPDANIDEVIELLRDYGIKNKIFEVSILDEESIADLRNYLCEQNEQNKNVA